MIKKFLLTLALLFTANAYATSCQSIQQVQDLDKEVKQAMIVQCEQAKLNSTDVDIKKIDMWSEISLKFAKAIGVAAREFGVAVNDFLATPAGKLTSAIIIWKVLEGTIGGVTIFIMWILISTPLFYFFRKGMMVTENFTVKDAKGNEKVKTVLADWNKQTEVTGMLYFLSYCVQLIGLIIVLSL